MLTLQACAATTTGTSIPPGGGLERSLQAPSSFSSSPQHHTLRHSSRSLSSSSTSETLSKHKQHHVPQPQQHCQSRKRSYASEHCATLAPQESDCSDSVTASVNPTVSCPRLQNQQLCLPRRSHSMGASIQGANGASTQCSLDANAAKANFVDCLVGECLT